MEPKERKPSLVNSNNGNGPSKPPRKRASGAKPWPWHVISHVITLLWLAPAIVLLYLNLAKTVIGNTLWCPSHDCVILGDDQRSIEQALDYDRRDHDVNGALLFVQKGVEVWFTAVATLLVYEIAMMFARREGGLPVGYLLAHLEFTDLMNLFNPLVWKSASSKGSNKGSTPNDGHKSRAMTFSMFAVLITFLTIIANLMGPAGGVLVLPTVQWVETSHKVQEQFHGLLSADPPSGRGTIANCSAADLLDENYACANYVYAPMLENIISSVVSSARENAFHGKPRLANVFSSEAQVQFSFDNGTSEESSLAFVPNRQALRSLSTHVVDEFGRIIQSTYNDSIEATAHRSGPVLGTFAGFGGGNITTVNVTAEKSIRCLDDWNDVNTVQLDDDTATAVQYTKCIRMGKGWSAVNEATGFQIRNRTALRDDPHANDDIIFNIYFTDKTTYFNKTTDFGSGLGACSNTSYRDCDWDAIFSTPLPYNLSRISTNSMIVEAYREATNGKRGIWADFTTYPLWGDYQVRLSPFERAVVTTTNASVPNANTTEPLVIHPNWVLAAWSVNSTGAIAANSTIGTMIANLFARDIDNDVNVKIGSLEIASVFIYATTQALSLITYNTTDLRSTPQAATDKAATYFYYWRRRRVWMYSLGSRTSYLGVVIVVIGMVVVVLRSLLALYEKIRHNYSTPALSATDLVLATLAHEPEYDEPASAQARYRIEDDGGTVKFRFQKTDS